MVPAMAIGHRIKQAREAAGLTQRELATVIGVSDGLVGQWESHKKKPGRETLRRLAETLLVDMATLLSETQPSFKGVTVIDPNEIALLRRFRLMSPRQRENLLELLGVALDVRREIEKKREPT